MSRSDRLNINSETGIPPGKAPHEPAPSALQTQAGGSHYTQMKIQPVEYINANGLDFLQGNIVKYATRHKAKNGAEDIRKIIHYCELILELQYGEKPHAR